jgi:hypothetical protein
MKCKKSILVGIVCALIFGSLVSCASKNKGLRSIKAEDMEFHMKFLSADEFRGRNTPSIELKIASRYIALIAEEIGLLPLLPDGSYLQEIPLAVSRVSEAGTHMISRTRSGQEKFLFPQSFGVRARSASSGSASGEIVFLGLGIHAPDMGWDDYLGVNLEGKVAVFLDAELPEDHVLNPRENRRLFYSRGATALQRGAVAVLSVIDKNREDNMAEKGFVFDNPQLPRRQEEESSSAPSSSTALSRIEIRHGPAASILGVSEEELAVMYDKISSGSQVESRRISGRQLDVSVQIETYPGVTHNVVAYIEGSDPSLKEEYVLFGSHHDGIGYREDRIFNGADDNISGVVAMFELAEAMLIQRPKRSLIFVWHTGEEKGLWGAYHFVANSPVPVDKMSAELNMDMICRNDPDSIYLIGSNKLSSELDAAIHKVNDNFIKMNLDYTYEDPGHPDRFFFRSDQYPYIRYGIPGVWFFCGTTEDYHQETDTEDRVDYVKMERVTRFVYLTALEIGNKHEILKLDLHPGITTRGEHNMEINWRSALENTQR